MTALTDGGWVVTWVSSYEDGSGNGIYAKRYDASGNVVQMKDQSGTLGDIVRVATATSGNQSNPSVIQLAGGDLVFAWDSPDASGQGMFARRYGGATGLGPEFQLNSYTTNDQSAFYRGGVLAALADGGWAVVWNSDGQDGYYQGVYGQVYNADGTLRHAEFQVSSYATYQHQEPQITSLPDGGFMVTWTSNGQDGDSWGVYAQRYDAHGDRIGTEFRLNTTVSADQSSPAITVQGDGSGVVFACEDNSAGNKVVGKRIPLPDAGTSQAIEAAGAQQQVNVTTTNQQTNPVVTKLADGSYVVAWQSYNQDGYGWGVYARHYDAAGHEILWNGAQQELQLSTFNAQGNQYDPTIVGLADGTFAAAWYDDHAGASIYVRRFAANGTALALLDASGTSTTAELRVNSFAPSNQNDPSLAALANGGFAITWQNYAQDGSSWGIFAKQFNLVGGQLQMAAGADVQINTHVANSQTHEEHTNEVDPMRGTTAGGFVIGFGTVSDLFQNQATRACCCSFSCGPVGNAPALSKRSVRSTALAPRAPLVPARHTARGACPPSA